MNGAKSLFMVILLALLIHAGIRYADALLGYIQPAVKAFFVGDGGSNGR